MLPSFYVKYEYPITGNSEMDKEIKSNIDSQVQNFYHELDPYSTDTMEYSLEIMYEKKVFQNYETTILYTTIFTGGAHPTTTIQTFTYKEGKKIEIQSLFTQGQLQKLSKYISDNLLKHPGAIKEMIEEGTKPSFSNFRNFYYAEQGIVFLFEQYQVAPYSSGIIDVLVSNKELEKILNE